MLIVDGHATVREGLSRMLESGKRVWKASQAGSCLQALDMMRRSPVDLLIIGMRMPGMASLETMGRVRREFGRLPVLVLGMHAESQHVVRAFKGGAHGDLMNDRAGVEPVAAVCKVAGGRRVQAR